MRPLHFVFLALLLTTCGACTSTRPPNSRVASPTTAPSTSPAAWRWEREVNTFLDDDAKARPADGGIVFTGSSSIRLWRSLKQDFAGLEVKGRGIGGSITIDVIRYADVLVMKHRPKTVVFYCGENDLTAKATTPQDVLRHFQTFVDLVHRDLPQTRIVFISIKPSPSRIALIEKFRETNALIASYIQTKKSLSYVDVFSPMLNEQGQPREELFGPDRLHMNAHGYALWTSLLRPLLQEP